MVDSADTPIRFLNRSTGEVEEEEIYGESFLRWAYANPLGRATVWAIARRAAFSKFYGWRMNQPPSATRIAPFLEEFGLDKSDFLEPPESFTSFNAFFSRKLKPEARPIDSDPATVVFPADGRHLAIPELGKEQGFFVKGQRFELAKLLDDTNLARDFEGGTLVLSRLCPVDYHRFHFPVEGIPGEARRIEGHLYSVSPLALRRRLGYLWENTRTLCLIESDSLGKVATIEVGATCVGSIQHTFQPGKTVSKGAEKGYFEFGGSSTITLFQRGAIQLADDLSEQGPRQLEVYAKMGEAMGSLA